jgi:hypothetical protein
MMKHLRIPALLAAGAALTMASNAWGTGTLAITSVQKSPMLGPVFTVTGTCVQGPVAVKIKLQNVSTGTVYTPWTSAGGCGVTAATTGKTVPLALSVVPAGTYKVALKQGSSLAYWQVGGVHQTITLP